MDRLRLCTFKGLQNLAVYVARREGFFAAHGLEVAIAYTAGSASQMAGLARGDYDLVQTAPDNVINVNADPAAFGLDPASAPRVVMVLGGSVGPLSLYAQPTIATLAALRGQTLGVDNPSSGFALVMRDMLGRAGLVQERDYSVAVAGGTSARLDALRSRSIAATILYAPYDVLAAEEGFRRLAVSTDYYAAYASLATAGIASWLEEHHGTVTRYIAAVLEGLRWMYDPAHAAAREILQDEPALALDASTAARAHAAFVDPEKGFGIDARLSDAGLRQVIALRAAYAAAPRSLGTPDDHQDPRWYRQALAKVV